MDKIGKVEYCLYRCSFENEIVLYVKKKERRSRCGIVDMCVLFNCTFVMCNEFAREVCFN